MPIESPEEFLATVVRSGIVDEERLARTIGDVPVGSTAADVDRLAQCLLAAGLLTAWQLERLLDGKWRGFFLGKYKILYPLGAGAMGSVFLGEHKVMRHRVAIKVLARRLVAKPTNVTRFEREARAAAVINHPNVVRAFDIDRDGENHYLVMEYVEGENLQKLIQQNGPLEPRVAADYVRQVARGLHEAHKNGLIHRDIKPSNLLLDPNGLVKVLDLGLARMEDDEVASLTMANDTKLIGTVDYLAPEQARNSHEIDGRADIYSLGCTLYFLLTGSQPFPQGTLTERIIKHQTRRPLDPRQRRPGIPAELVSLCDKMMEKKPSRRFASAGETADALTAFLEGRYDASDATDSEDAIDFDEETELLRDDSDPGLGRGAGRSSGGRSKSGSSARSGAIGVEELDLVPSEKARQRPRPATPAVARSAADVSIFDELGGASFGASSSAASNIFDALPAGETLLPGGSTSGESSPSISAPSATHSLIEKARREHASESHDSGINYPLWFLVASGIILGFILIGVGYSYLSSFGEKEPNKKVQQQGSFEN